ncbi:Appr-1-p processing protein [Cystobacter fuscus]|uniref:type II toxin-antitoxin system antitoxin DNA ADP-ribosyl glycohydrolase DarG n=1 Tax=Cystobacter fuscus TaxID=43 RepID=UPI002B29CE0A|nr:Appr-1-p processing protein [Cystobacter fuscus]
MVERTHGNLLDAKVDALVNTVNTVGVMGKGIALQFKRAFPENFREYEAACKAGRVKVGKVLIHDLGGLVRPQFIINFPTKEHWRAKSKIEFIEAGLEDLVEQVRRLRIRSIALPPLGCGNGGLNWDEVYVLIEKAFMQVPDVSVYVYEPKGAPEAASMPNRTKRPTMTAGRAAMIALMRRYIEQGLDFFQISLLEIQKLAYFLQESGHPLKLNYRAWYYGPYADNLRHVLSHIEGHFIDGYGDGQNKPDTPLTVRADASTEAEVLVRADASLVEHLERVERLIDGYSTPFGMELLGTVHWVATHDLKGETSPDLIVESIRRWSARKAAKMTPDLVAKAHQRLREQNWL